MNSSTGTALKKGLLTLAILTLLFPDLSAQLQKHDFRIGVGLFSSNFLYAVRNELIIDPGFGDYTSKDIDGATGALYFSYRNYPIPRLSIGATIGLERVKGDIQIDGMAEGRYSNDFLAGAIEIDYLYLSKPHLQLYSGMGFGVAFNSENNQVFTTSQTDENVKFIYHMNVIGIRVGGTVGFFLEAGYGYRGMARAGLNIMI